MTADSTFDVASTLPSSGFAPPVSDTGRAGPAQSIGAAYVHLEADDELGSIREKLQQAVGNPIVLIAPRYVKELRNPVRLKLLARFIEYLGHKVILVAADGEVRRLAKSYGLTVTDSLRGAEKRIRKSGGSLQPTTTIIARPGVGARALPRFAAGPSRLVSALVGLGIAAALLLAAAFVVPSATVDIAPVGVPMSDTFTVVASRRERAVIFDNKVIPARSVQAEIEVSDQTNTSGRKTNTDERAKGKIRVTNRTPERATLRKGVVVRTAGDIRFTTDEDVSVPGNGGTADVAITAVEAGTTGNVARAAISSLADSELATRFTVNNEAATTGGSQRETSYVTVADRTRLRNQIQEKVKQEGYARLYANKRESESVYREAVVITVLEEVFDRAVDDEAQAVTLTTRARVSALAFDSKDLHDLVNRQVRAQVPPGQQLLVGTLEITPLGFAGYSSDNDSFSFGVGLAAQAIPAIDENALKSVIAGRNVDEAAAYLTASLNLRQPPVIEIWPNFMSILPRLAPRIQIRVASA